MTKEFLLIKINNLTEEIYKEYFNDAKKAIEKGKKMAKADRDMYTEIEIYRPITVDEYKYLHEKNRFFYYNGNTKQIQYDVEYDY